MKKKKSLELTLITRGSFVVSGSQARVIVTPQPHPSRYLATSGDIFGVTMEWEIATGISQVKAMDVAKHPIVFGTTYHNEESSGLTR